MLGHLRRPRDRRAGRHRRGRHSQRPVGRNHHWASAGSGTPADRVHLRPAVHLRDRVAGFRRAMAIADVDVDERLIQAVPFRGDSGSDAVSALLSLPPPPTAIIVANTAQVRSSLRRIKQSALVVPDDLSVIVFDDNPWTELVSPPLSVVRQPIDMLALHSVDPAMRRPRGAL